MYDENASKLPSSSDGIGGFSCSCIYLSKDDGVSNVNMSGDSGLFMSRGESTKPFTFIVISSRVSANIWFIMSKADCKVEVLIPTAPIHIVSFVPIANSDV